MYADEGVTQSGHRQAGKLNGGQNKITSKLQRASLWHWPCSVWFAFYLDDEIIGWQRKAYFINLEESQVAEWLFVERCGKR